MIVHILVTLDEGRYHAHTLDFDLMSVGESVGESIDKAEENIELYLEGCRELGIPFHETLRRAPEAFWNRFNEAFFKPDGEVFVGRLSLGDVEEGPIEQAAATV